MLVQNEFNEMCRVYFSDIGLSKHKTPIFCIAVNIFLGSQVVMNAIMIFLMARLNKLY
jgi:hypothetical protein